MLSGFQNSFVCFFSASFFNPPNNSVILCCGLPGGTNCFCCVSGMARKKEYSVSGDAGGGGSNKRMPKDNTASNSQSKLDTTRPINTPKRKEVKYLTHSVFLVHWISRVLHSFVSWG